MSLENKGIYPIIENEVDKDEKNMFIRNNFVVQVRDDKYIKYFDKMVIYKIRWYDNV